MKTITFYHAGRPVCVSAEHQFIDIVNKKQYEINVVHLGKNRTLIEKAKNEGVQSVPALVSDSGVFHINFGAAISDLI